VLNIIFVMQLPGIIAVLWQIWAACLLDAASKVGFEGQPPSLRHLHW
jgi:hypothetical protein